MDDEVCWVRSTREIRQRPRTRCPPAADGSPRELDHTVELQLISGYLKSGGVVGGGEGDETCVSVDFVREMNTAVNLCCVPRSYNQAKGRLVRARIAGDDRADSRPYTEPPRVVGQAPLPARVWWTDVRRQMLAVLAASAHPESAGRVAAYLRTL